MTAETFPYFKAFALWLLFGFVFSLPATTLGALLVRWTGIEHQPLSLLFWFVTGMLLAYASFRLAVKHVIQSLAASEKPGPEKAES